VLVLILVLLAPSRSHPAALAKMPRHAGARDAIARGGRDNGRSRAPTRPQSARRIMTGQPAKAEGLRFTQTGPR
jgi:hypothetical protein